MTTNVWNNTPGRLIPEHSHSSLTTSPYGVVHIVPSTTSPNNRSRLCVQIVMKYAPRAV